ncbi:MAG: tRNA uridine-5-carboxymethylaminomethyl(34) synthesis GTPase MnmE [Firmicutes bacterium]|nr:tRNA uridine-5-carboxymethylaminomethyl(34) synthesis GTPase MnmE [Bacillota bacterium]MDY5770550.1 tRNA uridine-5-carboxymethylaminomethyl(34) synthesis GTPase MnmE [Anaerovoracaceae bacterium]
MYDDTIAAVATAMGEGGIGIVRISGENALSILEKVFCSVKNRPTENRKLTYGFVTDNFTGEKIDEVMAVYMKAPHSYTAEDVVEIQCHGSIVSLRKILALVLKNGARLAEPGEFTKRAFLNGRLDLSQAEAVIDLVRAKSDKTFDVALSQLEGSFSKKIKEIRSDLVDILVNITVNIDYPDEDIEVITYENLISGLGNVKAKVDSLLATADTGRILREGLNIAIIGKPNVGKSSLMNALLRETRAIVTEIPGTTRDTIEEALTIRNIPVKLTDTAGIRHTDDVIEKIGIEKSKESFNKADLVIFMVDNSRPLDDEDREIIEYIGDRKVLAVINKTDLENRLDISEIKRKLPNGIFIETSMAREDGISRIEDEIENLVYGGKVKQNDSMMVTNVRHKALLEEASSALRDAASMAGAGEALEFLEIDVNRAYEALGEIIGEAVNEDIINEVFARFCLGK